MPVATVLDHDLDAAFFAALADPSRLRLFCALACRCHACRVADIAATSALDGSVVSRHLQRLAGAGLAHVERRGRESWYRIDTRAVAERLRAMAAAIDDCCGPDGACTVRGDP